MRKKSFFGRVIMDYPSIACCLADLCDRYYRLSDRQGLNCNTFCRSFRAVHFFAVTGYDNYDDNANLLHAGRSV